MAKSSRLEPQSLGPYYTPHECIPRTEQYKKLNHESTYRSQIPKLGN